MSETYQKYIDRSSSEKIIVAHASPAQRLMVWTLHSGSIYKKSVEHFVINCEVAGIELTEVASIGAIVAGSWFFDSNTKILYSRVSTSVDPTSVFFVATYKLFFSNKPISLPHDLSTGRDVYYQPLIDSVSQFGQQVDHGDQVTVSLEGSGNISFHNNSGEFRSTYDKLFWENKPIEIYSLGEFVDVSNKQIIYQGNIEAKSYTPTHVTFSLKDFISVLRDAIPLPIFDGTEGDFPDNFIGKTKRRIYGRVAGLKAFPLQNILEGFYLSGTWTITSGSNVLSGVSGNLALDEASQDDEIFYLDIAGKEQKVKIKTVDSNSQITLVDELEITFIGQQFLLKPARAWRKKNRTWQLSGHALREPTTTVSAVSTANRFSVTSITDIEANDFISVNGTTRLIRRVSGNEIVLFQALPFVPSIGHSVIKSPLFTVFYKNAEVKSLELNLQRDLTYTNTSTSAEIEIDDLAEFNIAKASGVVGFSTFTNGSRIVTGSGTSYTKEFRPRDWINAVGTAEWYEILQIISDQELHLRVVFSTATLADAEAKKKNPELINDETLTIVDCAGKTFTNTPTGAWVKTAGDVVKDLITEAGLANINTASFTSANIDCNFLVSMKVPSKPQDSAPTFREVIDDINKSVFGSLHKNKDFEIVYNVLSADKLNSSPELTDKEILSWDVKTESKNIVKEIVVNYRAQDINTDTGEEAVFTLTKSSEIAEYLIKTSRSFTQDLALYKQEHAEIIRNRYSFFKELSESIITVKNKINLANKNIGDVIYFKLDRLYDRFGTLEDTTKIGIISSIKTNGVDSIVEIDDLAGFYLTVANVAPNDAPDFEDASEENKIKHGYIVNPNEIIDPLEFSYRSSSRIG